MKINNILATVILALFTLTACEAINKKLGLKDDNVAEELFEGIIDNKTGFLIDLTPDSPEVVTK